MVAADGDDSSEDGFAVFEIGVVGRAASDVRHENAVFALPRVGYDIARGYSREHKIFHFKPETLHNMQGVCDFLPVAVEHPVGDFYVFGVFADWVGTVFAVEKISAADSLYVRSAVGERLSARVLSPFDVFAADYSVRARYVCRTRVSEAPDVGSADSQTHRFYWSAA